MQTSRAYQVSFYFLFFFSTCT